MRINLVSREKFTLPEYSNTPEVTHLLKLLFRRAEVQILDEKCRTGNFFLLFLLLRFVLILFFSRLFAFFLFLRHLFEQREI